MEIIYKNDGKGKPKSYSATLEVLDREPLIEVYVTGYGCDKKEAFKELKGQFAELKIKVDEAAKLFEEAIETPSQIHEDQHFSAAKVHRTLDLIALHESYEADRLAKPPTKLTQEALNQFALQAIEAATATLKNDPALKPSHYNAPCSAATRDILQRFTGFNPDRFEYCKDLMKAVGGDYFTGATIKYLWRCAKKGEYVRDLGKAIEHLKDCREGGRVQTIQDIQRLIDDA